MYFQTLDDKKECIGIYHGEQLHFDKYPENLSKTWKASSSVRNKKIDYAWIFAKGADLEKACPEDLLPEYKKLSRKFKAYIKAFSIANVPMDEMCFFDLVPQTFLLDWCELKNQISHHVFENYEKPAAYDHLVKVQKAAEAFSSLIRRDRKFIVFLTRRHICIIIFMVRSQEGLQPLAEGLG